MRRKTLFGKAVRVQGEAHMHEVWSDDARRVTTGADSLTGET